jgi:DNA-binding Lrp family transcriptional regulator
MSRASPLKLDPVDRAIVNALQGGFPLTQMPYADAAKGLGLSEASLIARLQGLLDSGALSRFGPMYNADRMGGGNVLAAMKVAADDFERVADQVNAFAEVSHNYARDHALNMWFVISTEDAARIEAVIEEIEAATGYPVYAMPKEEEFFVGLRFEV